jgi:hypothetical protein
MELCTLFYMIKKSNKLLRYFHAAYYVMLFSRCCTESRVIVVFMPLSVFVRFRVLIITPKPTTKMRFSCASWSSQLSGITPWNTLWLSVSFISLSTQLSRQFPHLSAHYSSTKSSFEKTPSNKFSMCHGLFSIWLHVRNLLQLTLCRLNTKQTRPNEKP